jgi:two-component system OmpR family response regulator
MRILVIEQEPVVQSALGCAMTAREHSVDTAGNGVDGLRKATENSYDVIVVDGRLSGLDGSQVCGRLRAAGRWTPVLVLAATDDDVQHVRAGNTGSCRMHRGYPASARHNRPRPCTGAARRG